MRFNCLKLEPLRGGSLIFTTKFPQIPGTHLMIYHNDDIITTNIEFKWNRKYMLEEKQLKI